MERCTWMSSAYHEKGPHVPIYTQTEQGVGEKKTVGFGSIKTSSISSFTFECSDLLRNSFSCHFLFQRSMRDCYAFKRDAKRSKLFYRVCVCACYLCMLY